MKINNNNEFWTKVHFGWVNANIGIWYLIFLINIERWDIEQIWAVKSEFKHMLNHQQLRRKYSNNSTKSNNASTNSLLSMRDCRKPLVSREKSKKLLTQHEEPIAKTGGFKSVRDYPPKTETAAKNKKEHPTQNKIIHEPTHGISINVNIQNLVTPKNSQNPKSGISQKHLDETNPKNQRHQMISEQPKKPRKISNLRPDPESLEFQCTEEFIYKKPVILEKSRHPIPKNNNMELRNCSKQLILTRKKDNKEKMQDVKEVLKKFEAKALQIDGNSGYQALMYLDGRQQSYMVQPDYIERKQKNFTWLMRAFLVEWIMQVCYQFGLKRETFHISVNLVDRFLERQTNLPKSEFQLVGLASMFISSKLQEFEVNSSEQFVKSANGSYTAKQIKQMQKKILKVLKYNINPPTLYRWGNRLMMQWDSYIKQNAYAESHLAVIGRQNIFFKECNQSSYINYRQAMQMLDCCLMDIQSSQYNPKHLVCGFLYLILGKQMEMFSVMEIVKQFPGSSLYLLDQTNLFNDLFNNFLNFTFGFPLIDLLPTVQYCATYFLLPPNVDKPITPNEDALETMQLQEYCSFQTYDRNMYIVVKKRFRGVYI